MVAEFQAEAANTREMLEGLPEEGRHGRCAAGRGPGSSISRAAARTGDDRLRRVRLDVADKKFSLIIPAYNEQALLPRLLDSVDVARSRYRGGVSLVIQ